MAEKSPTGLGHSRMRHTRGASPSVGPTAATSPSTALAAGSPATTWTWTWVRQRRQCFPGRRRVWAAALQPARWQVLRGERLRARRRSVQHSREDSPVVRGCGEGRASAFFLGSGQSQLLKQIGILTTAFIFRPPMAASAIFDLLRPSTRNSRGYTQLNGQTPSGSHTAAHRLAQASIAAQASPKRSASMA